jgi:hypothetical protein
MKNILLTVIVLIFIIFPLMGQKNKDVLYLKNGSTIYGKLMEISDNQYKIKTSEGSIFIFSTPEVEKFVNEKYQFEGRKKSGLGFVLEAGVLIGSQSSSYRAPFSFNFLANVTTKTQNIFGVGSGVEYLGQPFMPIFFEYKYLFSTRKSTPFIFFRGGSLFHLNGDASNNDNIYNNPYESKFDYRGGGSFTIGTGISWAYEDSESYLSFAYRNAHTSYTQKDYNSQAVTYRSSYNRLEIKFGFRF